MIDAVLVFFGNYLIEFMAGLLVVALVFRFIAYRASKRDRIYFSTLTREMGVAIEKDKEQKISIVNVDDYLSDLMGRVSKKMPNRTLRIDSREQAEKKDKVLSLQNFMDGKQGFLANIQAESSVFHCQTPPNFNELTSRILGQDDRWNKLLKHIPMEGVSRMIDIMPGLFIVFGVFGTFVGISMALPEIAKLDFNNLEASGTTLTTFVLNTTYAMKTSIAGIFFSVILTFLNTFSPIKDVRISIFKQIEASLQTIWYHVQQSRIENNKDIDTNETMERLVAVLERLEQKFPSSEKKAS